MSNARRRSVSRPRHFGWLLALMLWLPLAQLSAATHALLHLHASVSEEREAPAQLPGFCDTCIEAAAIGGAAPLAVPPLALPALPRHAPVRAAEAPTPPSQPHFAYRSRAPPLPHA
jgi:hypothetical protein